MAIWGCQRQGQVRQFTGIPYYPQFGRYIAKRSPKGGFHIIIPGEPVAAMAALGAAGVIWALRQAQGDGGSGQAAFGWAQASGNPYLADLPGMVEKIKAGEVVGGKGDGKDVQGDVRKDVQGSMLNVQRNGKAAAMNNPWDLVSGIAGQEPDSLTGKVVKEGAKKIFNILKKRFL